MKKCEICESTTNVCGKNGKYNKDLCGKHRRQMFMYGKILDRTIYDSNEIIEYSDHAEVVLYNKDSKEIGRALIDLDDIPMVSQYKWGLNKDGYVVSYHTRLHRLVMKVKDGFDVDHIHHNKLDNRKSQLRNVTTSQNLMNSLKKSSNTSGYVGVSWNKHKDKWDANIKVNGNKVHLGRFADINDAIAVRKAAEIKYFGEFRYKGALA